MSVRAGEGLEAEVDDVVVGTGFGGAVTAYRLAEAGRSVTVLERGKAYPPGSFPRSPRGVAANFWDPSAGLHGMFDVWSFSGIDAVVSSGLGGGSLIYANVALRKDPSWFRQPHPYMDGALDGVEEAWPFGYEDLEPHYERVEKFLDVQKMPFGAPGFASPKTAALRQAAADGPGRWDLAPLAVGFRGTDGEPVVGGPLPEPAYGNLHGRPRRTCRLCGECDLGCNDGAKNSLDHTYLSAAVHHGATISTRTEVRGLHRRADGRFDVEYVVHSAEAEGQDTATASLPVRTIVARRVVLAAGALGSTYLLLHNRRRLGITGPALGTRFCGNGDLLGFVFGAGGATPRTLDAAAGPVITSYVRYPDRSDTGAAADLGMYIEDAGYPAFAEWLAEATQAGPLAGRLARTAMLRALGVVRGKARTNLSSDVARVLGRGQLSGTAMPLLGMGRDVPDGTLFLRDPDVPMPELDSSWTTASSDRYFATMKQRMTRLAEALDGRFEINPTYLLRRVITVHPLGGSPMGTTPRDGVVGPDGQVFGVPGLFVADGSVMPGPVGANPSLTIAALADRIADGLTGEAATAAESVGVMAS